MKTKDESKCVRRTGSNFRPKAVSAATMGKALAVFATSCAAFQSSPTQCRIGMGTGPIRPTMTLQYRYGNETDAIPIRMQAEADRYSREKKSPRPVWRIVSLPQLTFLRTASVPSHNDQQNVMDEYLEYVDRRYSRILENSVSVYSSPRQRPVLLDFQVPRKIFFSTLALQRGRSVPANTSKPTMATPTRALAELNALGLTDLASARLRQRLQAPRDLRDEFSAASYLFASHSSDAALAPQIEVASPSPAPVESTPTKVVAQPTVGGRVSLFSGVGPIAQYQLMLQTLRKLIQAFVTSIMIMANFASRVIPQILEKGGFRHSVRALTGASLALLFMFKPLFKGAMES